MHLWSKAAGAHKEFRSQIPDYRFEWVHLAFVSDETAGCWYAYINGVRFGDPIANEALDTELGQNLTLSGDYLDELRLRTSPSSDEWIEVEYLQGADCDFLIYGAAEVPPPPPGFVITVR